MNAPEAPKGDIHDFAECCDYHAWFYVNGWISLQTAVDNLQWLAERWGLVDLYGQDEIQREIAQAIKANPEKSNRAIAADLGVAEGTVRTARANSGAQDYAPDERVGRDGKSYPAKQKPRPYTPGSTVDAFWIVVDKGDPDYLADWLAQRPQDVAHLHKIWGLKCSTEAA